MEIGNSVFMEYIKNADGTFGKLPKQNVDFGGGLERLAAAARDNSDVFLIDVFESAHQVLEKRSGKEYQGRTLNPNSQVRPCARSELFSIICAPRHFHRFWYSAGNSEQGYVLRRLIRRSIREADKLGIKEAVLAEVAEGFGAAYASAYPFIQTAAETIRSRT